MMGWLAFPFFFGMFTLGSAIVIWLAMENGKK